MAGLAAIKAKIRGKFSNMKNARIQRRKAIFSFIGRTLPFFIATLLTVGYTWLLILPSPRLGRTTYIDENALQPSQVNTYYNWADVHRADRYLEKLEDLRDRNASSEERAKYLKLEFVKLGLHAATQAYNFTTSSEMISGVNSYAVFSAPRTSGTEAMVISASWLSRTGTNKHNLRGVATVLSLAGFLKRYSHWAKDIIFVIGDGQLTGTHAWLSAYHHEIPSNLQTEFLSLSSGVIWNALNIDYPGHSFSHLGAFHEGLNGRLPNQDLYNSFRIIATHTGNIPVILYDHIDPRDTNERSYPPSWIPSFMKTNPELLEFSVRARNIARNIYYQASGKGSGVHALYHKYRIDAFTIFAVPAEGPHGFYSLGRVIESTLRTMNNLLERLHASFFFYILSSPGTFLKIGYYLPSVIMISVALMFTGLREWTSAGWMKVNIVEPLPSPDSSRKIDAEDGEQPSAEIKEGWERRSRPVLDALLVMLATHVAGSALFFVHHRGWMPIDRWLEFETSSVVITALSLLKHARNLVVAKALLQASCRILGPQSLTVRSPYTTSAPISTVLKAFNLFVASTFISVTSLLNFWLAALLCVVLGLPLTFLSASLSDGYVMKNVKSFLLVECALILYTCAVSSSALWDWSILGVWFTPLISIVSVPILLQAAIASSAP